MIDYNRYHLLREEAVMIVSGYPDLEEHRGRHQKLIAQVYEFAFAWRRDHDSELIHRLRRFLRDWLTGHIMNVDTEIAQYTTGKEQDIRNALERLG